GGGQSALESAALLKEAGAEPHVFLRGPKLHWVNTRPLIERFTDWRLNPFKAPARIGPMGINWLVEHPRLFRCLPRSLQYRLAARAVRPAASTWLRPRLDGVPVLPAHEPIAASTSSGKLRMQFRDGQDFTADHVLLGTGYKIDLTRYRFL